MIPDSLFGRLREGWCTAVDEYPTALAWSHRGNMLLVADAGGGLTAVAARDGATVWRQSHGDSVMALAAHPQRAVVASAGQDGWVHIWDLASGNRECSLSVPEQWVEHLQWSPQGDYIAASSGRYCRVWTAAGDLVWTSTEHASTVSGIAWSPAGELLSACYGQVSIWQPPDSAPVQCLQWKGSLISLCLSPDGDIVACGSQDNSVHFWRRGSGKDSMMSGYSSKPLALAFDPSGSLLATGGSTAVTVWCFSAGGPEGTAPVELTIHTDLVTSLCFARRKERLLASGGRDGGVVLWSLDGSGEGAPVGAVALVDAVEGLAWRPDDRALAVIDAGGGVSTFRLRE